MGKGNLELGLRSAEEERAALEEVVAVLSDYLLFGREVVSYLHNGNHLLLDLAVNLSLLFERLELRDDGRIANKRDLIIHIVDQLQEHHNRLRLALRTDELKEIELGACVRGLLGDVRVRARASGINLSVSLAGGAGEARVPHGLYYEVIDLLLSTAFEAVEGRRESWIKVAAHASDGQLILSISFGGRGRQSPPRRVGLRLSHSVSGEDGVPLWTILLLAKKTLERVGGEIAVESGPRGHAAFLVKTPLRREWAVDEKNPLDR